MPVISKEKKDKISEQILHYLFTISPESKFTSEISEEMARDEEFTKYLLMELERKKLIVQINKNKSGKSYTKRARWLLSNHVFEAYSRAQEMQNRKNQLQNNNVYNEGDFQ